MHDHYFSILPQHLEAVPKTFDDVRMSCLVLVAEATGPAAFPVERRVQACPQPREANPLGGAPSGARLPPAARFQVYVNSDVIFASAEASMRLSPGHHHGTYCQLD